MPEITPRREVRLFALAMEERLRANECKGGWKDCTIYYLLDHLRQEVKELQFAILGDLPPEEILREAADIANFAMMVSDVCGALAGREETTAPASGPTAREIVALWLRENGYDGLYYDDCGCSLDDLAPCSSPSLDAWVLDCRAGYKRPCDCGEGCDWHIGPRVEGPIETPHGCASEEV